MKYINNDKAGATTASYSCNDYAHKNHVSPLLPYSPVGIMEKGTGRYKAAAVRRS